MQHGPAAEAWLRGPGAARAAAQGRGLDLDWVVEHADPLAEALNLSYIEAKRLLSVLPQK